MIKEKCGRNLHVDINVNNGIINSSSMVNGVWGDHMQIKLPKNLHLRKITIYVKFKFMENSNLQKNFIYENFQFPKKFNLGKISID